jgi:hypothetical protein
MNLLRPLLAFFSALALAGSLAFAEGALSDKAKPAKAACGCPVGKDGKTCGIDKDCCCTGEKAKGKAAAAKCEQADKCEGEAKAEKAGDAEAGKTDKKPGVKATCAAGCDTPC